MPVKGGPGAKSRLEHPAREQLARAFALDAVTAALACPVVGRVIVVTADDDVAHDHAALGATTARDPGLGLAAALLAGREAAPAEAPCGLLLADLPCLRSEDLVLALAECRRLLDDGGPQVSVPDADGQGTVLLAAAHPARLRPAFGGASAQAHALTSVVLGDAPARLRRDVDTAQHLREATALGLGPRTATVLAAVL